MKGNSNKIKDDFSKDIALLQLKRHLEIHHKMSANTIAEFLQEQILIPTSAFNDKLSILESVVKFLKEEHDFNYHKIGEMLSRNERNIWTTYNNSLKKMKGKLDLTSNTAIPICEFAKEAGLFCAVRYLKEDLDYNYHKIGNLLCRDERTIWVTYNKKKK